MCKFVLRTAKNLLSRRFLNLSFFILSISKHSEYKNVKHRIRKVSTQTPSKLEIAEYIQTVLFNNSSTLIEKELCLKLLNMYLLSTPTVSILVMFR